MHWFGWVIIATMALGLGLACLAVSRRSVLSITPTTKRNEWKIETELVPGPLARLFGAQTVVIAYEGEDGEWYELLGGKRHRTDPEMEMWLFDHWNRARVRGEITVN